MNEQQIKFIIEKINEGWSYEKIGKSLNIDKRKISSWCKNNNHMSKKAKSHYSIINKWPNEKINKFKEMYLKIEYGYYRYTYNDILNEFNDIKNRGTVQNIAEGLGLIREEKFMLKCKTLTYEQRKYIVENNDKKNVTEIAQYLKINERTVVDLLKKLDIKPNRLNPKYKKDIMLNIPEFKNDYNNLLLSPTYLSSKYDIDFKTIAIWRKQDFGDYTHRINGALLRSNPEQQFEDLLIELEIPYFYQWQIDNWKIDYYLGNKICIEIDGIYWHNKKEIIEKDKRKINDLKSKGYTIINFTENEIYNEKEKIKSIIKNLMPFKIKE